LAQQAHVEYGASQASSSGALMPFLIRILLVALINLSAGVTLHASETRATAEQRILEMIARCQGDRTCEQVVRKRETRAAEQRLERADQDRLLKASDPLAYYFSLWQRYLLFVLVIAGTAGGYVLVMNRLFNKKK
jgi:hypothetical protein